jgi:hypothetical protein
MIGSPPLYTLRCKRLSAVVICTDLWSGKAPEPPDKRESADQAHTGRGQNNEPLRLPVAAPPLLCCSRLPALPAYYRSPLPPPESLHSHSFLPEKQDVKMWVNLSVDTADPISKTPPPWFPWEGTTHVPKHIPVSRCLRGYQSSLSALPPSS